MSQYETWLEELVREHGRDCWVCTVMLPQTMRHDFLSRRHEHERCRVLSMELDGHHIITKGLLKREFCGAISDSTTAMTSEYRLWDPRNGVPVRRRHHDMLTSGQLKIPRALIPEQTVEFAEELGLGWVLDRPGYFNQEWRP